MMLDFDKYAEDEYATLEMDTSSGPTITLIKEEYESLPSFMKSLASWEVGRLSEFSYYIKCFLFN